MTESTLEAVPAAVLFLLSEFFGCFALLFFPLAAFLLFLLLASQFGGPFLLLLGQDDTLVGLTRLTRLPATADRGFPLLFVKKASIFDVS